MDEFNVSEVLKIKPVDDQRKERDWIKLKYNKKPKKKEENKQSPQKKTDHIIDIYV